MHIPLGLIRFCLAFFMGLVFFSLAQKVGIRLRRQSERPVYLQMFRAIGAIMWLGMFFIVFG